MTRARVTRREERRMARRFWHLTPWRSCTDFMGGVCLRCAWRRVTGAQRRAKAAHLRHLREVVRPQLTPIRYCRDADGRWRPVGED